jgi:glycosyltransferase involved in cell wall biosynthesis
LGKKGRFSEVSKAVRVIYISQGNVPSKWAHTFQAMKMAEALGRQAGALTLLTGGGLLPSKVPAVDLVSWYGIHENFRIVCLPVHARLRASLFEGYRYPKFDLAAAFYARVKSPDLVFTRSPYAGRLSAMLHLKTIIETHIETGHPEFRHVKGACRAPGFLGVVTVTDFLKDRYIRAGIPGAKIIVCPDAVDLSCFETLPAKKALRDELALPPAAQVATYCGHLYEHKGAFQIIEAAKHAPKTLFCLVGGWPDDIERCRKRAEGLTNIHFAGFVPNGLVPKYLAASDFLLLPNSMKHEQAYATSPLKLFEYMAARRPIIASKIPAFERLLRHRRNAYLIEPDSAEAIVSAIRVLGENPGLCARMAEQAWEEVQKLTWERRAREILSYFFLNCT